MLRAGSSANRGTANRPSASIRIVSMLVAASSIVALGGGAARGASTADELRRLRSEVADARRQADRITARYERAYAAISVLDDQIAAANSAIRRVSLALEGRRQLLRERVSHLYIRGSLDSVTLLAQGAKSALEGMRAAVLTDSVQQRDQQVIDGFRFASEDLARRRRALQHARAAQQAASKAARADMHRIDSQLSKLGALQRQLERRFAKEEAARRAAEAAKRAADAAAARKQAEDAARRADEAKHRNSGTGTTKGGGTTGGTYGLLTCPVRGPVSFTDTWGDPRPGGRKHKGVDILAPYGTPDVAVTPGRIVFNSGPREGLGVYLYSDNGNTYYYFHLSSYVGGPRRVKTGEVIGRVGSTGESGANHTHFEIHPGGLGPVDPYPAVRAVC
jgi:septal ring factor EnvC (AmiA/AmiB activator)